MPLQKLDIAPGLVLDDSPAASEGRWIAADKVRFDDGRAQTIGGWESFSQSLLGGTCRSIYTWRDEDFVRYAACGEHDRLEVYSGGAIYDITPAIGFTAGQVDGLIGPGWGAGAYSSGAYGTSGAVTADLFAMTWSLQNWGQNLLANPRRQGLFEWALGTATPAAAVTGAPTEIANMFVTPDRFVVLLGTTEEVSGNFNPMLVRWSDQEVNTGWTTTSTGEAGEYPLSQGSRLVAGLSGRQEHLIWSDRALFSMRPTFDDLIWSFPLIGNDCGLIGPKAVAMFGGKAYWMGQRNFFVYDGGEPRTIPCRLEQDVFSNIAPGQEDKIICGVNPSFREIWWFYPDSRDGIENSRYAILNVETGVWSGGSMDRTAWAESAVFGHPVAVSSGGRLYLHEIGETADGGAIGSFAETGLIDLEDGEFFLYINGCMPDFEDQLGGMQLTIYTRETARGEETTYGPYTLSKTAERIWFEACGRFVRFRLESVGSPEFWRMGDFRWDLQQTTMRV